MARDLYAAWDAHLSREITICCKLGHCIVGVLIDDIIAAPCCLVDALMLHRASTAAEMNLTTLVAQIYEQGICDAVGRNVGCGRRMVMWYNSCDEIVAGDCPGICEHNSWAVRKSTLLFAKCMYDILLERVGAIFLELVAAGWQLRDDAGVEIQNILVIFSGDVPGWIIDFMMKHYVGGFRDLPLTNNQLAVAVMRRIWREAFQIFACTDVGIIFETLGTLFGEFMWWRHCAAYLGRHELDKEYVKSGQWIDAQFASQFEKMAAIDAAAGLLNDTD